MAETSSFGIVDTPNGMRYIRIVFRGIKAQILLPITDDDADLKAFASVFVDIIDAATREIYVRDSMRDLDNEITDYLTPEEDGEE